MPDIVMKCPKCRGEFPVEAVYCEDCSAMLEPVETGNSTASGTEEKRSVHIRVSASQGAALSAEKREDLIIEKLRTDLERRFVATLLREHDQLRRRLADREHRLSAMSGNGAPDDLGERLNRLGGAESEMDGLLKRITRIESTIENLKEEISSEISQLEVRLVSDHKPGLFAIFSGEGRYLRALTSALHAKKELLEVVRSKRPPGVLATATLKPLAVAAALLIVAAGTAGYLFARRYEPPSAPVVPVQKERAGITEQDVASLLNDIRRANLAKDISLWESRYSRGYLASAGRREGILEQWSKADYRSLSYSVADLQTGDEKARAVVTWRMALSSRKDGTIKMVEQRLLADFVKEDGVLKIASVSKQ